MFHDKQEDEIALSKKLYNSIFNLIEQYKCNNMVVMVTISSLISDMAAQGELRIEEFDAIMETFKKSYRRVLAAQKGEGNPSIPEEKPSPKESSVTSNDKLETDKLEEAVGVGELGIKASAHTWFISKEMLGHFKKMTPEVIKLHVKDRLSQLINEGINMDSNKLKDMIKINLERKENV